MTWYSKDMSCDWVFLEVPQTWKYMDQQPPKLVMEEEEEVREEQAAPLVMEEEVEETKKPWDVIDGDCRSVQTSKNALARMIKSLDGLNRQDCQRACENEELCTFAVHDWKPSPSTCRLHRTKPGDLEIVPGRCSTSATTATMLKPPLKRASVLKSSE